MLFLAPHLLFLFPRPAAAAQDGDRFWRMPEAYIRGNTIKYLRVPDEVLDKAKEAEAQMKRDGARLFGQGWAAVVLWHGLHGKLWLANGGWLFKVGQLLLVAQQAVQCD